MNDKLHISPNEQGNKRPIVCFIPCCSRKKITGNIVEGATGLTNNDLPNTWNLLTQGRYGMNQYINSQSHLTSAIYLYNGQFYKKPFQNHFNRLINMILLGNLRVIVISAGYGIVDILEPSHDYNAEMKKKIAVHWGNMGLVDIINDFLLKINPSKVFGYFAGQPQWSPNNANYRYFFTQGLNSAIMND